MNNESNMMDAALAHAKSGRPVFPLLDRTPLISKETCPTCLGNCENTAADGEPENWVCPNCKCSGGAGCKDATTDPELIAKWWDKWPEAQIGMPTDGYFIIEVDGGEGSVGIDSLDALEAKYGILPETLVQTTPRGWKQCFFKVPEGTIIKSNESVLGQDIDVRGQGDYAVLAPSKNSEGGSYVWDSDPDSTPIAEAPEWIVGMLAEKSEPSEEADIFLAEDHNWVLELMNRNPVPPNRASAANGPNGSAALDAILDEMRNAPEDTVADTLKKKTLEVAHLIHAKALTLNALDCLYHAAADAGLPMEEAQGIIIPTLSTLFPKRGKSKKKTQIGTEDSAAVEFVAKHGADTRFCPGWGWMGYSVDSQVWKKGKAPSVFERIRQICRSLVEKEENPIFGKSSTYKGVAQIAQNDPAIYTTSEQWDTHTMLLGTPSGVVSLNGEPIEVPARELYITKSTTVAPEKGEPVLWMKFLDEITQGDKDLQRYFQQVAGYCSTGSTKEHAIFVMFGPGGNGKSVLLNTIEKILGDYAAHAATGVFTKAKSSYDRHTTDIAMLSGARLVTYSEIEEGRYWNESLLKSMTGGDTTTARFMRKNNFEFTPQLKLFVTSNYMPKILKVDNAMKRRMNLIPLYYKPEVIDRDLYEKLKPEHPRILNWMLEGCEDWLKNGFAIPQCVLDETAEYFAEQDLTAQWISERCEIAEDATEQATTLCDDWIAFMASKGENVKSLTKTRFGLEMAARMQRYGFDKHRTRACNIYRGIRLKVAESAGAVGRLLQSLANAGRMPVDALSTV